MKTRDQLEQEILKLINQRMDISSEDKLFDQLALDVFEYQFENNTVYRQYCLNNSIDLDKVSCWREIPPVPTSAFKECSLATFPLENAQIVFHTSGTTFQKPGKHYLPSTKLYDASLIPNFKKHLVPDIKKIPILSLTPSPDESTHSSLIYMIDRIMENFGDDSSKYFIQESQFRYEDLVDTLKYLEKVKQPVLLLGTAFSYVYFFDYCLENKLKFRLSSGSRAMETGGFKGKSREVARNELYGLFDTIVNIPEQFVVNEYGMTELGTQYYDNKLYNWINNLNIPGSKTVPPWSRIRIVNPETMDDMPTGESGLIQHFDLVNLYSVISIVTEDIGYKTDSGFEIIGRSSISESRGCSIAIDELLAK